MKDSNGAEVMARALEFLRHIETPVPVTDFTKLELTGNPEADRYLVKVSMMLLAQLKEDGFIQADDLNEPSAKIQGLTPLGIQMYELFYKIARV